MLLAVISSLYCITIAADVHAVLRAWLQYRQRLLRWLLLPPRLDPDSDLINTRRFAFICYSKVASPVVASPSTP